MTREEASAAGLKRYHGAVCRKCGGTERYVSSGGCVSCTQGASRARHVENPEASREYQRAWRAANPEARREYARAYRATGAGREKRRASRRERREVRDGRVKELWVAAKGRATRANLPFTLTHEWIEAKVGGKCEATGLPFDLSAVDGKNPWAPSLDQIVPGGGYTPENVQVVCWAFNLAKSAWGVNTVELLAVALVHQGGLLKA